MVMPIAEDASALHGTTRMSHSPIQLALHRLLDFAASVPPHNTRSPIPMCEAVDRLVALAAAFAGECRTTGGDNFEAHLDAFRHAVRRLDDARAAILQTLGRLGEDEVYVPDESAPVSPVGRRFVNDGDGLRVEFDDRASNAFPGILAGLGDVWDVVWDVPAAYRVVGRLLAARTTPELVSPVEVWRGSVREYVAVAERYQLFGTYLLEGCRQTLDPQRVLHGHVDFPRRLSRDFTRFTRLIVSAAEYQAGPAADQHARTLIGSGPEQTAGRHPGIGEEFHSPQDRRPAEFCRGPLAGPPKVLASMICPVFGAGTDRRALYKLGAQGQIWIVRHHSKNLEVYFRAGSQFDRCEATFQEAVSRHQRTKRRRN